MSKKFLSPIKLAQGASNPAVGSAGELFFNTTDVKVYAHNGTSWVPSGGGVTVSATAPSTPIAGDAWYDTIDGTLYVYYNDGDSSQWVEVAANSGVSVALAGRIGVVETYVTTLQTETRSVTLGGTGATNFTSGSYLKGAGTSAITAQSGIPATDITSGTLAIARGGTGVSTGSGLIPVIPSSISVDSGTATLNTTTGRITCSSATNILLNGVFTSSYRNYLIIINANSSGPNKHQIRFSVGGVIDSTGNYTYTDFYVQAGGTGSSGSGTSQTIATMLYAEYIQYWIYNPAIADFATKVSADGVYSHTKFIAEGGYNANKAFDGIWLANNAITGQVMVYGLRD